ncbi:MAG: hypothetical protein FWD69_10200 [Polyangiaceae bacterium]|nr:hypothetical protein [Polyangiaceae bacterium]
MADSGQSDVLNDVLRASGYKSARPSAYLPGEDGIRATIRVGVDLHRVVDDAIDALSALPSLYQRDGQLTEVLDLETELGEVSRLRALPLATLRERLTRVALWIAKDDKEKDVGGQKIGYRAVVPNDAIVQAVSARAKYPGIRPLLGVSETPILRPDGSVHTVAGYDTQTKYVHCPRIDVPLSTAPSEKDAREALALLRDLFVDFPYVSPASRDVPIAAILSVIGRPAIRGPVPAFIFDASVQGSGKSLQTAVISLVTTGRIAALCTYPRQEEEAEKMLASYALDGRAIVHWDNLTQPFGCAPIDKYLTSDAVSLRVLGLTQSRDLPWRAVMLVSGNNVQIKGDTTRRALLSRIEPQTETPETRGGWRFPRLAEHALVERPKYVGAALTLLRAHALVGRPACGAAEWGSYEDWSRVVTSAIVWAGGADVSACRTTPESDLTGSAIAALYTHWRRLGGTEGISVKTAIDVLWPRGRPPADGPPDGYDDLREAIEQLARVQPGRAPSSKDLGYALRRLRGRIVVGCKLEQKLNRTRTAVWVVVQVIHSITCASPAPSPAYDPSIL